MPRGPHTLELPTGATNARIAAFQGASSRAWPGRLAATIQIAGCPFRCPYCNVPELVSTSHRSGATLADILAHLESGRPALEGVVLTGGEPTSDPALIDLLGALREEAIPVMLETAGAHPEALAHVLDAGLVDFVAFDIKATPQRYDSATRCPGSWERVRESIGHLVSSGVDHAFHLTCYPLAVTLDDFAEIARELVGGRRLVLQQFRPQRTFDPAARSVMPYPESELTRAVSRCNPYITTVVRGA